MLYMGMTHSFIWVNWRSLVHRRKGVFWYAEGTVLYTGQITCGVENDNRRYI